MMVHTHTNRDKLGWHAYFPDIDEESHFLLADGISMLCYAVPSKDHLEEPHIFAHQRKVYFFFLVPLFFISMLCYAVPSKDHLEEPHILAHQRKVSPSFDFFLFSFSHRDAVPRRAF